MSPWAFRKVPLRKRLSARSPKNRLTSFGYEALVCVTWAGKRGIH
jgi:hypothetical protein